mgnify:CR=1 FL=1
MRQEAALIEASIEAAALAEAALALEVDRVQAGTVEAAPEMIGGPMEVPPLPPAVDSLTNATQTDTGSEDMTGTLQEGKRGRAKDRTESEVLDLEEEAEAEREAREAEEELREEYERTQMGD